MEHPLPDVSGRHPNGARAAPFPPPAWVREELGWPTGRGVVVGVIDSGWDRAVDDPRVLPGVGLVHPDDHLETLQTDDDCDRVGHGTACINQLLRIAPDVRVVPIRVFGHGLETAPETLEAAILYAAERGVHLVNLSVGTARVDAVRPLRAACGRASRQGTIIVAAGHNSESRGYPASFRGVLGVAAGRFDDPFAYRCFPGRALECEAWGIDQPVVSMGGETVVMQGTSFAAPNITGIVALLLERHPGATLDEVRGLLRRYAVE